MGTVALAIPMRISSTPDMTMEKVVQWAHSPQAGTTSSPMLVKPDAVEVRVMSAKTAQKISASSSYEISSRR